MIYLPFNHILWSMKYLRHWLLQECSKRHVHGLYKVWQTDRRSDNNIVIPVLWQTTQSLANTPCKWKTSPIYTRCGCHKWHKYLLMTITLSPSRLWNTLNTSVFLPKQNRLRYKYSIWILIDPINFRMEKSSLIRKKKLPFYIQLPNSFHWLNLMQR